ncbi:hypothetical protein [Candidatus Korobacter versatilis]|uniref:hypothetical protein n=1 Tax=Candidatus Korobacter versatilis TaxID=658062 RepID=UPI00031AAEE3|nr:hypothetical protein [Candidatus Koribacter versatilis]
METDFQSQYGHLDDEQLLEVAGDRSHLTPEAAVAVDTEVAKRGLTPADLSQHERFVSWSKRRELRILRMKAYGPRARRTRLIVALLVAIVMTAMIVVFTR